jgi:2-dehydro-3-deoxyphosphogluconate aldolase/(4S)-4-hydroxy-2-oxoglutarate aldolase
MRQKVVAVARGLTPKTAGLMASALIEGGIGVLEVTVEEEGGVAALAELQGADLLVGAGTVTTRAQAAAALEAGAGFLVSPHLDPALTRSTLGTGVPFIPGAFTPTEVQSAWTTGASAVKVFPASVGGPDLIAALRGPFPGVGLIPTGGVDSGNAAAYLEAGAVAVGVGGWLTGHDDLGLVTERAAQLTDAIGSA